ncbi:MAG: FUSC family protein [Clostridia bacterium]
MKHKQTTPGQAPHWTLPLIGQRIIKTTVAVFLCLLFYYFRGYRGQEMPTEAALTAIVCMQPYVRDTRTYAFNRFAGSLNGAVWGLLFLLLVLVFPALAKNMLVLYAVMALGVMATLYTAVVVRKPDTASLAAIVFLCIVISYPDISDPLRQAAHRMLGILVGTAAAVAVNVFRLPRGKNRDSVFFVRMKDLAPDRFSQISSAAQFRLNYLCQDGARICLMSEHAPAFLALQMSDAMLNMPLIVMDGAAIYDAKENQYLSVQTLGERPALRMREHLDHLGVSYFLYVVRNNKTCVFHRGAMSEAEEQLYQRMRRSPYRSYLDGENYELGEIVYFKILTDEAQAQTLLRGMQSVLHSNHLRAVIRREAGAAEQYAMYVYSARATMRQAESRLMQRLREQEPSLQAVEVFLRADYRSEYDAMSLLHRLGNFYEPLQLFGRRGKRGG